MKKIAQLVIGLAIGLGLLWFLFRDTNWGIVAEFLGSVRLGWLLLSQIPLYLSLFVRIQRWSYIVRAAQPVSFRHMFSATQIGFLANFTLPGRVGELIRAVVLNRLTGLEVSKSFAMVALDRVTDLFGLMPIMLVAIIAYQPTEDVVIPAATFGTANPIVFAAAQYRAGAIAAGLLLVGVILAFGLLYTKQAFFLRLSDRVVGLVSKKLAARLHGMLEHFAQGMQVFRSPVDMAKSIGFSLVTWGLFLLSLVFTLKAFNIECPWYTAFVIQSILAVFISVPGAPGFVGQYHVPLVISLAMLVPDMDINNAKAFAIVTHLLALLSIAIPGIYCLLLERVGLLELRRQSEQATSELEDADDETGS